MCVYVQQASLYDDDDEESTQFRLSVFFTPCNNGTCKMLIIDNKCRLRSERTRCIFLCQILLDMCCVKVSRTASYTLPTRFVSLNSIRKKYERP